MAQRLHLRMGAAVVLGLGVLAAGLPAAAKTPVSTVVRAALPPGKINHIIVIEFENEGYDTTFGPGSAATYLNGTLRPEGELLQNYYAIGHNSLDNYIAQVSGQAPTEDTQADCADNGFAFANVEPGTPDPNQTVNPGQVDGEGCVYPSTVQTIANQLDAKYPPNPKTSVASWRAYEQDMGNTPTRDGGVPDPTGGTDCGHPAIGAPDTAEFATSVDQYTSRHNPFVWFHSIIDNTAECDANVIPLGTLGLNGAPTPTGHLAHDLRSEKTTPRFAFITPNLCSDGHDGTCAGANSTGGHAGGLTGADEFLRAWMPMILNSPAYKHGDTLVVITFDEADVDRSDPALRRSLLRRDHGAQHPRSRQRRTRHRHGTRRRPDRRTAPQPQISDTRFNRHDGSYNHYSALRSYEDLLGLTTGGTDGAGHLGFAAANGLAPFGTDVFSSAAATKARKHDRSR